MIYLDNASFSVPLLQMEVTSSANASSRSHKLGVRERGEVEDARAKVSEFLGLSPSQLVFTSGATESADILWRCLQVPWEIPQEEHKCLSSRIGILREYQNEFPTRIFAKMTVNNETGIISRLKNTVSNFKEIAFVSDVTQATGKVPNEHWDFADFCFGSAHKWHGPTGLGFITVKNTEYWDFLVERHNSGKQERGVRPGTLNAQAIKHTGEVAKWMLKNGDEYRAKLKHLQSTFENKIKSLTDCWIIGADQERAPHITSLNLPGVDNEALIAAVNDRLAIASGSACTSEKVEPSHVLMAMFNDREIADTTVRISYGWFNTEAEVLEAAEIIAKAAETIRSFSL